MDEHIYKTIEITGTSTRSVEEAIQRAVERASKSVRKLRWFEVAETRGAIEEGKVSQYQVTLKIGFALMESADD